MKRKKSLIAGIILLIILLIFLVVMAAVCWNRDGTHAVSDNGEKNEPYKGQEIGKVLGGVEGGGHINEYDPSVSQFEESSTEFSMVKLESGNDKYIDDDTSVFTAGDSFEITS